MPSLSRATLALAIAVAVVPALPSGARQTGDPPERVAGRLFVRGMTRAFLGDDTGAIDLYREALARTPDDGSILGAMAEAHRRRGELGDAAFFARRAADVQPGRPDAGLLLAEILVASGDVSGALAELERLSRAFPDDIEVQWALADVLVRSEQRIRARQAFRSLADLVPGDSAVLRRLLDLELDLGNLEEALAVLDELDTLAPADAELAFRRGRILVQMGRESDAAGAFERASALAPERSEFRDALAALGVETDATGMRMLSGEEWRQVTADDPRNRDAWIMAVRTLAREGRTSEAMQVGDDALLLFPGTVRLEVEIGLAALLAARPETAHSHFEAGLRDLEERPTGEPGLEAIAHAGRRTAAMLVDRPGPMPESTVENPDALALAALIRAREDPEGAVMLAESALAKDPSGPIQIAAAAEALLRAGRGDAALSLLSAHLQGDPVAPFVLLVAGDVLDAKGRGDEARELWRRAAETSPESPLLLVRLGRR